MPQRRADARFTDLRVWRDLDQDGVTDAGELMTLAEAGVASISLTRTDVAGTTNGHDIGFGGTFTRTDGSTGTATDRPLWAISGSKDSNRGARPQSASHPAARR